MPMQSVCTPQLSPAPNSEGRSWRPGPHLSDLGAEASPPGPAQGMQLSPSPLKLWPGILAVTLPCAEDSRVLLLKTEPFVHWPPSAIDREQEMGGEPGAPPLGVISHIGFLSINKLVTFAPNAAGEVSSNTLFPSENMNHQCAGGSGYLPPTLGC